MDVLTRQFGPTGRPIGPVIGPPCSQNPLALNLLSILKFSCFSLLLSDDSRQSSLASSSVNDGLTEEHAKNAAVVDHDPQLENPRDVKNSSGEALSLLSRRSRGSLSFGRSDDDTLDDASGKLPRERRFILRMALALHTYGSIAPRTEYLIEKLGDRLGVDLHIAVFPSIIMLSFNRLSGDDTEW